MKLKVLVTIISTLLAFNSPLTLAQNSAISQIEQCREIKNALIRLQCYDEIPAGKSVNNPSVATSSLPETTTQRAKSEFGLENKPRPSVEVENLLNAIVERVAYTARRELIITLENGQVWQQVGSGQVSIKVGDQVNIKRGMLGAFFLGKDGTNRTLKVTRTK